MEWISVEKQLPAYDQHVVVYDAGEGICVGYYTKYKSWYSYPTGLYCADNSLMDVKYWMPLPEKPHGMD